MCDEPAGTSRYIVIPVPPHYAEMLQENSPFNFRRDLEFSLIQIFVARIHSIFIFALFHTSSHNLESIDLIIYYNLD